MVSTFSFNGERLRDPELVERHFKKGLGALNVLNYRDALLYFSRSYSLAPESYYGELSYLYLGKAYALYSYAYGSKRGIMASIGFLNQYPFHYKVPRFLHTQREFIADSYLLLQWYGTAKNIYANLYGETEKAEYMLKYGYAASLEGSVEGFKYLRDLSRVPANYADLYHMTIGFYEFNLGRYERALESLTKALDLNPYLREDTHLLFRVGVSYLKVGDWRRALLYLKLAERRDPFKTYFHKVNFYLAFINLETNNFREAYQSVRKLIEEDGLFYLKLAQVLFSSLWYYEGFLEVYGEKLGDYRGKLLKLGWLNVEDIYGELPALGIYYLAIKSGKLSEEEKLFLKVKDLTLREFILGGDLFEFGKFIRKNREALRSVSPYVRESALLLTDLYTTNRGNFLKVFGDVERLARALVFLGNKEAREIVPFVENLSVRDFLMAKLELLEDRGERAAELLSRSVVHLSGDDRIEAQFLLGYLRGDAEFLEEALPSLKKGRLSAYRLLTFVRLGDLYYERGELQKAALNYRRAAEAGVGWALFRLAIISERLGDGETLRWVVKKAEEEDNIWSKVVRVVWGPEV